MNGTNKLPKFDVLDIDLRNNKALIRPYTNIGTWAEEALEPIWCALYDDAYRNKYIHYNGRKIVLVEFV